MHELEPAEFYRVASLFEHVPYGHTIPNSVIAGWGRGRVFVDDALHPAAALVYNYGACTLAGDAGRTDFAEAVCRWLLAYQGSDYFILTAFPNAWEGLLDRRLAEGVTKRPRLDFDFVPSAFAHLRGWGRTLPPDYELRRIDPSLMERIRDEVLPYSRSYWRSVADFVQHGVGFCVLHEGEIVSLCYTCFAWNGHHDIDIMTIGSHMRRGLGFVVACAFIEHCLNNGLTPDWDCWSRNQASVILAGKLGFVPRVEVKAYHGVRP